MRSKCAVAITIGLVSLALGIGLFDDYRSNRAARAASISSYSTLGTISMDSTPCGSDDTNSVLIGKGIRRIVNSGSGVLYVVGCFLNFAGVPEADFVAKWDGTSWSGLGNSGDINGTVYDATIYKGNLVVVGNFEDAGGVTQADMIAGWDQTLNAGSGGWFAFESAARPVSSLACSGGDGSPKDGLSDYMTAIAVDNQGTQVDESDDALVVGGYLYNGICSGSSGYQIANTKNIARWTGTAWEALDDSAAFHSFYGTTYIPRSILVDGDNVYIGSYRLTSLGFSDGVAKYKHAFIVFDGTAYTYPISSVSTYSDGSGNGVFTLAKHGTSILLGGTFGALNGSAYYLAEYSAGTIAAFNGFSTAGGSGAVVRDVKVVGTQVMVAGAFAAGPTGSVGGAIARWNGSNWSGFTNSSVYAANTLAYDTNSSTLFVGSGNTDMGGLAAADGLVGVKLSSSSGFDSITSTHSSPAMSFDPNTDSYALSLANAHASEELSLAPKESAVKVVATMGGTSFIVSTGTFTVPVGEGESVTVTFSTDSTDGTSATTFTVVVSRAAPPATTTTTSTTTTSTTLPPTTTTTTMPPSRPEVRVNGLVSLRSIAQFAGLSTPPGSSVSGTIAESSKAVCKVQGVSVKGLHRGRCNLTVRVTKANGQRVSRITYVMVR